VQARRHRIRLEGRRERVNVAYRASQKQREEFLARLQDEFPEKSFREVLEAGRLILRHSATYARIQETWCNEEMDDARTKQMEAKEARLEARLQEICQSLSPDCAPDFQGDPRGTTVKIKLPSGYTDDWGRTGFCVPGC
jgi:hypothetical protein